MKHTSTSSVGIRVRVLSQGPLDSKGVSKQRTRVQQADPENSEQNTPEAAGTAIC